jgi:hypothetical protein
LLLSRGTDVASGGGPRDRILAVDDITFRNVVQSVSAGSLAGNSTTRGTPRWSARPTAAFSD